MFGLSGNDHAPIKASIILKAIFPPLSRWPLYFMIIFQGLFYHFIILGFSKCHVGECHIAECVLWHSSLVTLYTNPTILLWLPINVYVILSFLYCISPFSFKTKTYALFKANNSNAFTSDAFGSWQRNLNWLETVLVTALVTIGCFSTKTIHHTDTFFGKSRPCKAINNMYMHIAQDLFALLSFFLSTVLC